MHSLPYLPDVLILLTASILNVLLSRKLKLSPVLGYLLLGAAIGRHGFDLIKEPSYAHNLSEFGIVFLLFVIGLELTFERIIQMRLFVFGFGGAQLVVTSAVMAFLLNYFLQLELVISVIIGAALTLSSTAIVLQVLSETKRQSTQVGRLSLSVLLMQDLAVVPLLAILPILAYASNNEQLLSLIGLSSLKALIAIAAITVAGRIFLRPFFSVIGSAKSEEIYVSTTLLIVLGSAMLTSELGLSTAMGAFIAGILIAETEYRNRVENSILPFKSLLLGLFFLSVGMSIDIELISQKFYIVIISALVLLSVKGIIIFALCKLFKFPLGASLHSGLLLAQGSEFAFILFNLAAKQNALSHEVSQLLLVIVSLSMAVTPLLSMLGAYIEDRFDSGIDRDKNQEFKGIADLDSHIVIAGFGRVGRVVAQMLYERDFNYVAIDSDLMVVKKARIKGFPVYHGDLSDTEVLKAVGSSRARAVILTMNDKYSLRKAVKAIHNHYPNLKIIARSEDFKHGSGLKKLGATDVIPSTIEMGLQMGGSLLKILGVVEHEIIDLKEQFRRHNYSFTEEIELFSGIAPSKNTDSY
jgi:monovalent cation:H+ antiporter-2, CPA2 family